MKGNVIATLAAAALGGIAAASPQIVFDNTSTSLNENMPLLPEWLDDSAEVGDELVLAGTAREIVELRLLFFYRGTVPGTFDARIRFRLVDEDLEIPSTIIYESPLTQVTTLAGANEYTFAIPNVEVPDRFVWTIQAFNRQGSVGELGPSYYNPPTVGSSDDFFWQMVSGDEWSAYSWGGEPYANFGAQVLAVPEPATLTAVLLGFGFFARRKRAA